MYKNIFVSEVADEFIGEDRFFNNFAPIDEANDESIVWSKHDFKTNAKIIVCSHPTDDDKTFIISSNPRYTYLKIVERCLHLVKTTPPIIGDNCRIHPTVIIHDNTVIGDNVEIHPYCVIGSEGFGFEGYEGKLHKFPHIGGVVIGDDVEIQALTNVDRGALGDTVIGSNTKIDTQCHIGHNCKIGGGCTICRRFGLYCSLCFYLNKKHKYR